MDILSPQLQYIDGICYRMNPGNYYSTVDKGTPQPYYEFDSECSGMVEPENEENYDIEKDQSGNYKASFHVPKMFFSYIIGAKGTTRRRLESETATTITVPKLGCAGDIVITGWNRKSVSSAINRIKMLVLSVRKRQRPTHFLSFPLACDSLIERFNQFKESVMEVCPGLDPDLFQIPEKLHLTLCMLKLCDDVERDQAVTTLNQCHQNVVSEIMKGHSEMRLRVEGIEILNDDPSAVDVLYAKVTVIKEPTLLQTLTDAVADFFILQGLAERERNRENVLLHLTLMNSRFLSQQDDGSYKDRIKFDASKIFEMYKDFNFGEVNVTNIDISIRKTQGSNGYYQHSATIDLFKF